MIDRTFGTWKDVYGNRTGTMGGSPERDARARVVEGGWFRITLGFRDGRVIRLGCRPPVGSKIADVASALAEGLASKGLEVDVVPEFGTLRLAFTKGLCRIEASGPDGFTFESHFGERDEFTRDASPAVETSFSSMESEVPVAALRLLRYAEDKYGRVGVFELRNLSPVTLYYNGISADFPCSFEDEEWKNGDRHHENRVTCGNGTSTFSLAPGAFVEFTARMPESQFTYLRSTRVGVHLSGVPGTMGRGADIWSELFTADAK